MQWKSSSLLIYFADPNNHQVQSVLPKYFKTHTLLSIPITNNDLVQDTIKVSPGLLQSFYFQNPLVHWNRPENKEKETWKDESMAGAARISLPCHRADPEGMPPCFGPSRNTSGSSLLFWFSLTCGSSIDWVVKTTCLWSCHSTHILICNISFPRLVCCLGSDPR